MAKQTNRIARRSLLKGQDLNHQHNPEPPDPMLSVGDPSADIDKLYAQALADIEARGESPADLLAALGQAIQQIKDKHHPCEDRAAQQDERPTGAPAAKVVDLPQARHGEEVAIASSKEPGSAPQGEIVKFSDLLGRIELSGKIMAKVADSSMRDSAINDGDVVLVDPSAEIRDGDIVLADVAGHGKVIRRLRLADGGPPTLISANPDFQDILVPNPCDLRIQGRVVWRCGPAR